MKQSLATAADLPFGIRWLTTAAFGGLLVLLSVTPGSPEVGDGAFHWLVVNTATPVQKALHVVAYATFAMLLAWSLEGIVIRYIRLGIALAIAIALGAALEWWQLSVPGRFGNLLDIVLNSSGALAGLLLLIAYR